MKSSDIQAIKLNSDYFLINWHPTRWCNYHCSYCVSPKESYVNENKVLQIAEYINKFINRLPQDKKIYFKLLGGEVAFYNWINILDKINRINKISMTTNFSNSVTYYKELYIYTRSRNINFCLMCSKHDENKDYDDKIIELTKWCLDYGYSLPICRLMVDNNFDLANYEYLKNNKVKLNLSVVRGDKNKIEPLNETLSNFMKQYWKNQTGNYATVITSKETFNISNGVQFANTLDDGGFDPTDFDCSAGYNGIFIEPDGSVYRCGCKGVHQAYKVISIKDFKLPLNKDFDKCFINNKSNNKIYCNLCWYINLIKGDNK